MKVLNKLGEYAGAATKVLPAAAIDGLTYGAIKIGYKLYKGEEVEVGDVVEDVATGASVSTLARVATYVVADAYTTVRNKKAEKQEEIIIVEEGEEL